MNPAQHYIEGEKLLAAYNASNWPDAPDIAALPALALAHFAAAAVPQDVADEAASLQRTQGIPKVRHIVDIDSLEDGCG